MSKTKDSECQLNKEAKGRTGLQYYKYKVLMGFFMMKIQRWASDRHMCGQL